MSWDLQCFSPPHPTWVVWKGEQRRRTQLHPDKVELNTFWYVYITHSLHQLISAIQTPSISVESEQWTHLGETTWISRTNPTYCQYIQLDQLWLSPATHEAYLTVNFGLTNSYWDLLFLEKYRLQSDTCSFHSHKRNSRGTPVKYCVWVWLKRTEPCNFVFGSLCSSLIPCYPTV